MSTAPTQLQAVGTAFLLKRPVIVAPGIVCSVAALLTAGVPSRQLLLLGAGMGSMFGLFCIEALICTRREVSDRWLSWSLRITVLGLAYACAVTGGVRSPFVPLLLAPVVVGFAAFGRRRDSMVMAAMLTLLVVGLSLLPTDVPFPPVPAPYAIVMTAAAALITLALAYVGVAQLSDALVSSREIVLRMREDALQSATGRLASLETIGSKVAHEIKNPLASIKALAQLSARGASPSKLLERFGVVLTAAEHMEGVLDDYLSFARPLDDLKLAPLDLDALLDEAIAIVEGRARASDVLVQRAGSGGRIVADRRRLLEALLNLLTNAIEASEPGGRVDVALEPGLEGVSVEIVDHGPGLSRAQLERLGTPYFTTKDTGTGLGVVIARAAVRHHGGTLRFDSEPGAGVRARIALPTHGREDSDGSAAGGR